MKIDLKEKFLLIYIHNLIFLVSILLSYLSFNSYSNYSPLRTFFRAASIVSVSSGYFIYNAVDSAIAAE